MKNQRMSVKRRSVKKSKFRTLFANVTKKKRHRAATTAISPEDLEGDVPNLGIGRALLVILAIHVVAIGGIFFHSYRLDHSGEETTSADTSKKVVKARESELDESVAIRVSPSISRTSQAASTEELPVFRAADQIYSVGTGDSYSSIASRFGIDEMELRSANENIELRQGRRLRIPPKSITAVEPAEVTALRMGHAPPPTVEKPAQPDLVPTEAALAADARSSEPLARVEEAPAPRAIPVSEAVISTPKAASEEKPKSASGARYKVKSGDTFWSIAKRHGKSVDSVMKANGISDARKLRVGMNLVIPN